MKNQTMRKLNWNKPVKALIHLTGWAGHYRWLSFPSYWACHEKLAQHGYSWNGYSWTKRGVLHRDKTLPPIRGTFRLCEARQA